MENEYKYRKHLVKMGFIMPLILIIFAVVLFALLIILSMTNQLTTDDSFGIIFLALLLLFEGVLIRVVYNKFVHTKIILNGDHFIYSNKKQELIIKYSDINRIEVPSIKYLGGWIKILTPKKNIRLTVVLHHIDKFVIEFKKHLDNNGLSDTYNRHLYSDFYKTATFSEHSWNRLYRIWLKYLLLTIAPIIITVILIVVMQPNPLLIAFIILVSIFLPLFGYILTELVFFFNMRNKFEIDTLKIIENDESFESKIYKIVTIFGVIIYCLSISLLFIF